MGKNAIVGKRLAAPSGQRRFGPLAGLLTRYTLREIAVPALMAIAIIGFVGVANELRERQSDVPLQFISGWDVTRLVLYFSPTLASYIIPITYMMGILLAFGALAQNNEITAMKASGIPLLRLVLPVIGVGLLLSIASFLFMDRVQPWALSKANHLLYVELPQRITLEILPTGSMQEIGDWRVYIGGRDPETKTLSDIVIRKPGRGGEWVFYAKTARFIDKGDTAALELDDGQIIIPQEGDTLARSLFSHISMSMPAVMQKAIPSQRRTMTLAELETKEAAVAKLQAASPTRENTENLRNTRNEIAERLTLPLASLAVSFLAAPLAVRSPRSGRSYSFALGFLILFAFYMLRKLVEPSGLVSLPYAVFCGMIPILVLCGFGLVAVWRVDRV